MSKLKISIFPLKNRAQYLGFCIFMSVILAVAFIAAARLGSVPIDVSVIRGVIINLITGKETVPVTWEDSVETILVNIRFPRVLSSFVVGAGLTLCGILMQAITKNPLADPYVLGISNGASAGAVYIIMYGALPFMGRYGTMIGAFIGAVISIILAMKIATIGNKVTATQLVLAGIAVSAFFSAVTNFMIYYTRTGSDKVKAAQYWMMGSLTGSSWFKLGCSFSVLVVCTVLILVIHKSLDVLLLGDDVAATVGVETDKLKVYIIVIATLLAGVIVSISGAIGFIGLIIPHITRSIVGTKHSRLVPASILVGGTFVVIADIICRVIVAPEELPIGVVSAFFGAPFFMFLIRKSHGKFGG